MTVKVCSIGLRPWVICIVLILAIFLISDVVSATYKKPPFNGSIFGKRSNGIAEFDSIGQTMSALCEVTSEVCSAWFTQIDVKKK